MVVVTRINVKRVAAKRKSDARVITEYRFDIDTAREALALLVFDKPDNRWLEFVCQNRMGQMPAHPYDIAMGPVADDLVYATVVLYEQGLLSKEAAIMELKVRELYNQILFHTDKSLRYCQYVRHMEIGGHTGAS